VGTYWDYQAPSKAFQNNDITLGLLRRDSVQYNKTRSAAGYLSGEYDASSLVQGLKLTGGIRYTHDTIHSVQNTYIAPIDAPLLVPTLTAVLESFGLSPADAAAGAAATTAPIPYGKCVTYGVGGLLTGAAGSPCLDLRNKFHAVTWTAGASYQFPSGQMIYAKISRGYRPGGVNSSAPQGLDPAYQPEYDRSIEAGLKGDWSLGGMSLRTNLAAYYDRYTNIQKDVVLIGAGGVASGIVANIAAAKVKGVEFEGTLVPVHGLTLGTIFAYTDAKYDRDDTLAGKTGDPCDPTQLQNIGFCSRNLFAYTPKYQLGLTADWTLPLDEDIGAISVGGQFNRVSKQSLSSASKLVPGAIEPAHSTLDLNARWRAPMGFEPVELSVFVTNVTDKLYRIGTNNLTQNSSLGTAADIYAPPRMFGVSVRYRFGAAGS
jgi:iron complex outermembrane receptor protein